MNKLLLSAAACALLTPIGACARDSAQTETADTKTTEETAPQTAAADPAQTIAPAEEPAYETASVLTLPAASMSAKELLGEDVEGANGDTIARVDDVVIGADGRAQSIVVSSGEFLGLGGKKGALDFKAVDIAVMRDNDPDVSVSMTEDAIEAVAEFVAEEQNDYSLASEILGAEADLLPGGDDTENVVVNDIIFDPDGAVEYLIVQKSVIGAIGAGDKYAVAYSDLTVEQGDGGLVLAMTETELDAAPKFDMSRADINEAWEETKAKTKDAADKAGEKIEDAVD